MTLITPQIMLFSLLQLNTLATPKKPLFKIYLTPGITPNQMVPTSCNALGGTPGGWGVTVFMASNTWMQGWPHGSYECVNRSRRHWRRLLISHTQIAQVCFTVETGIHDSSLGIREEVTWDRGFVCQLLLSLQRPKSGWIKSLMNHPHSNVSSIKIISTVYQKHHANHSQNNRVPDAGS